MKVNVALPFVFGMVCGITVMLFGNGNDSDTSHQDVSAEVPDVASDESEEIPVLVVSAETILAYQWISEEMVTVRSMRTSDVPADAVEKFEELEDLEIKSTVYRGDVITRPKLTRKNLYSTRTEIPVGFRVFPLNLEASALDIGSLRPYDLIDVFAASEPRDARGDEQPEPQRILERIRVFAVGKPTTEYESKNISLLLEPKRAATLLMAVQKGPITVVPHEERKASDP